MVLSLFPPREIYPESKKRPEVSSVLEAKKMLVSSCYIAIAAQVSIIISRFQGGGGARAVRGDLAATCTFRQTAFETKTKRLDFAERVLTHWKMTTTNANIRIPYGSKECSDKLDWFNAGGDFGTKQAGVNQWWTQQPLWAKPCESSDVFVLYVLCVLYVLDSVCLNSSGILTPENMTIRRRVFRVFGAEIR